MKTIPIPIYGGRLIVAKNQAEFDRAYDRVLVDEGLQRSDEPVSMCSLSGLTSHAISDGMLVIVSGAFNRRSGTRCHEAVHCAQAVAEAVNMNPLLEQEAFAYLTEWFFEELAP